MQMEFNSQKCEVMQFVRIHKAKVCRRNVRTVGSTEGHRHFGNQRDLKHF